MMLARAGPEVEAGATTGEVDRLGRTQWQESERGDFSVWDRRRGEEAALATRGEGAWEVAAGRQGHSDGDEARAGGR
jgi:hypothetical protein